MLHLLSALVLSPQVALAQRIRVPDADYAPIQMSTYDIPMYDFQFPSGLRIIVQAENSQPVIAITSAIDRGSEYDQEGMDGIAHVVEHLAFRAQHGDLPKNWDFIQQLGGSINASTSVDWTNYMTIAPVDSATSLLAIEVQRMVDGVRNVTEEDVRTESEIARNELRMRYENAAVGSAWDALGAALFPPDHPYARSTIGSHETLGNLTLEAVQEYVEDNYRPENFTIVMVGDIVLEESWDIIRAAFQGNEHLWMAPEDAEVYLGLGEQDRIDFFNEEWAPRYAEFQASLEENPIPPRVDCDNRAEPPMPTTQETATVQGMVDNATVVLAWSLPGGYCEDQPTMQMASNLLTNYIYQSLYPTWEYANQDSPLDGIGCFPSADEYFTQMICFIEPSAGGGYEAARLIEKAADALYLQWDQSMNANPMVAAFMSWNFDYAKASTMASMLQSVDEVSTLSGRATTTAMFTHFTGEPRFFQENMNRVATLNLPEVQALAQQYITRDRMVSVIVEPMDEEERERREAAASAASNSAEVVAYHATTDEDRYASLFDADELTPEIIADTVRTPDLTALHRFTLDNGLQVAILPYGDAPLVQMTLQVNGNGDTAEPFGLDTLAEAVYTTGGSSNENLLSVAGFIGAGSTSISASGADGNVDALLNKMRWQVEDYDWAPANRRTRINSWIGEANRNGEDPETWASRLMYERLFPNHVMGQWLGPQQLEMLREVEMDQIRQWIYSKWRPGNAELFIVGNIDVETVEASVRTYFDSWAYRGEGEPLQTDDMPIPTEQPERQVLVFDKPIATQSQILLGCQLAVEDELRDRPSALVVGDVLGEMAWRRLREEAGVTYGAGAYTSIDDGGTALLIMSSLVQNDAVGFGVETMLDLVNAGATGDVDEQSIANAQWTRARTYVLGQQSGQQMLNRLVSVGLEDFSYFETYPEDLGNVSLDVFEPMMSTCVGQEVVTIVGPREYAEEQLSEIGVSYEIVDWETLYMENLSRRDLRRYLRAQEEAAEEAAEEEEAGVQEAAETETEPTEETEEG